MFFLVLLKSGEKKIVPMKWVSNLNLPFLLNRGVTFYKKKEHLVFISSDINVEPDFTLQIFELFQNNQPALYTARVLKCSGECFSIKPNEIELIKNHKFVFYRFVRKSIDLLPYFLHKCTIERSIQ